MALSSFKQGSNTYFELFISCPVCHDRGNNTPQTYWQHYGCGGELYVGDNAYYHCNSCKSENHVMQWKYGCPNHSSGDLEFISSSKEGIAAAMSTAGQLVSATGLPWLRKFLENL